MEPILSEGVGYFILIGLGSIMALVITLLIKTEFKWLGTKETSEWFSTAGRNIKSGLIAASVVSAWTWAATLLQSSTVAYQFGISGPFWYAAGASIQIVLFAIIAIELKRKAPTAHTFLEVIHARFGKSAHRIFLFFALMTNTIVTTMLVLGGASVVYALTGVNIYIAALLIPFGVIIYTFFGGLKATFLADYLNAAVIFIVLLIFVTSVYFLNPEIGGISGMYKKLEFMSILRPVEGNAYGSYITMSSIGALIFGIINIVGNFGTVFVDQAYWQRAIAAEPKAAPKGFILGGLAWFSIPFTLATTLGLTAVALGVLLEPEDVASGLTAPIAATKVLGDIGAILILTMLFMAVTSAGSAELIAVSSLVTYDMYRTYVKSDAADKDLIRVSKMIIIAFGIGVGSLASVLLYLGANLQYVYLSMGILISSAVVPIALSVLSKKANKMAVTAGAIIGLTAGISIWLYSAFALYGNVSIYSTGQSIPLLVGNITSLSISTAISFIYSVLRPADFNFKTLKRRISIMDERIRSLLQHGNNNEAYLEKIRWFSYRYAIVLTLALVIAWPLPLYFSNYVFSEAIYYVWVTIAVTWSSIAAALIIVLPLIEERSRIIHVWKNLIIPSVLAAIIIVTIIASILLYSSIVEENKNIAEHILVFIYSLLGVMGSFAIVVIMLNRKLSKLVEIRTRELELANTELRRKDKLKDEFISIAAHELRTPVQPILGFINLAKKGSIDLNTALDGILRHAKRLQHLTNEILDVSRIESGNLVLHMDKVMINDVINDVVNILKSNINNGVSLNVRLDENIEIYADKIRINQALTNILDNAIKFTKEGEISVESRVLKNKARLEISISDTGGGISEDLFPILFEKFVTRGVHDGNNYGIGLGLFISRAIINAHNGEITVHNNDKGGATFTIVLPLNSTNYI